jgi:hypothetical protein
VFENAVKPASDYSYRTHPAPRSSIPVPNAGKAVCKIMELILRNSCGSAGHARNRWANDYDGPWFAHGGADVRIRIIHLHRGFGAASPISPRLRALPRTRRSQDGIYREMDSATEGWPELSGLPRPIRGLARAAAKQQLRTGQTRAFRRRSLSRRAQRRLRGPKGGPTRTDAAFLSTPRPGRSRTRPRVRRCHGPR